MDFSINLQNKNASQDDLQLNLHDSDCLVLGIFSDYKRIATEAKWKFVFTKSVICILDLVFSEKDFNGHLGETFVIFNPKGINIKRLLLVGLGPLENFDKNCYFEVLDNVASAIKTMPIKSLVCALVHVALAMYWDPRVVLHAAVIAYRKSQYKFSVFKSTFSMKNFSKENGVKATNEALSLLNFNSEDSFPNFFNESSKWLTNNSQKFTPENISLNKVVFALDEKNNSCDIEQYQLFLCEARAIADGIDLTCNLANAPANVCTPSFLAEVAKSLIGTKPSMTVDVLDREMASKKGLNAFLAVAQGSSKKPYFIVIKYNGAGHDLSKPTVLIGKGVTFDSGGISIKPSEKMDEMRYDMSGAATVLGVMEAASQMKLKLNLIGIIPACENMPSGSALKPGDVIKSLSGKTIEVLNTDAEGRLVLCDALTYAERFHPYEVIDIATLTGACVVALGHHHSGLFSNADDLAAKLLLAGQEIHDTCWRLPLDSIYKKQLESNFADIANIGGRAAGSITAACFLSYFAQQFPWAHLDIAGTAWSNEKKGATGRPVHLLLYYLIKNLESRIDSKD